MDHEGRGREKGQRPTDERRETPHACGCRRGEHAPHTEGRMAREPPAEGESGSLPGGVLRLVARTLQHVEGVEVHPVRVRGVRQPAGSEGVRRQEVGELIVDHGHGHAMGSPEPPCRAEHEQPGERAEKSRSRGQLHRPSTSQRDRANASTAARVHRRARLLLAGDRRTERALEQGGQLAHAILQDSLA